MFGAEHLHHVLPRLRAVVIRLQHPSLIALCDPPHLRPEFTAEHQAMKGLGPVLRSARHNLVIELCCALKIF